jgi:hypothetical protein
MDSLHFLICNLSPSGVFASIEAAGDLQSFRRGSLGDEIDDGFIVSQWLPTPIRRDEGKESVLDFVPFARAGWKMTDGKGEARFIREILQFQLPKAQPGSIAPTAVGGNHDHSRARVQASSFVAPPSANRCHGKSPGVVVGSYIDKADIASHIVDAIGIGAGNFRGGKVVPLDLDRLFCRKPLPPGIVVVADEFLLLCVHRNHGNPLDQRCLHLFADVPKLRIAVGMISAFLGFAIALEAVVQIVKNLAQLSRGSPDVLAGKVLRQSPECSCKSIAAEIPDHLVFRNQSSAPMLP